MRADVDPLDAPLIQFMVGAVMDRSRDVEPELWRRYLGLVLDGLRPVRRDAAPGRRRSASSSSTPSCAAPRPASAFCAASGDASQNSSILVASPRPSCLEIAHRSTGSSPSLRCERGVFGATRIAVPAADLVDVVADAERERPARDEVDLLDLVVEVAGALLEVRVRRDADQRQRDLLGSRAPASGGGTRRGRRCPRSGR